MCLHMKETSEDKQTKPAGIPLYLQCLRPQAPFHPPTTWWKFLSALHTWQVISSLPLQLVFSNQVLANDTHKHHLESRNSLL